MIAIIGTAGTDSHKWARFRDRKRAKTWLRITHAREQEIYGGLYLPAELITEREAAKRRYRDGRHAYPKYLPGVETYTVLWKHSGRQGQDWNTAREASRFAAERWGEVEADCGEVAAGIAQAEGLDVGGWYETYTRETGYTLHVIPSAR